LGILVENLSFGYGGNMILQDISMNVGTGEYVGIVGVSGCGKSTLLKLLAGLYPAMTGIVEVEGKHRPEDIRRQVAMVMQDPMLFPASIRDNITCGHEMSPDTIMQACRAAQLTDWIAELPDGIDTFVGERGGKVSGGQAQRIAIARAIAKDAPVILLDEATSALDDGTSSAVLAAIESLTRGKTVVSVSHQPRALEGCSRIYRLEGGRLNDS
jgi:ATP-binding cassette subfamily B protein/subfamily B ATP-binding cassette protein MsbA